MPIRTQFVDPDAPSCEACGASLVYAHRIDYPGHAFAATPRSGMTQGPLDVVVDRLRLYGDHALANALEDSSPDQASNRGPLVASRRPLEGDDP